MLGREVATAVYAAVKRGTLFGHKRLLTDGTPHINNDSTTHIFRSQVALSRSYSMLVIRLIQHLRGRIGQTLFVRVGLSVRLVTGL